MFLLLNNNFAPVDVNVLKDSFTKRLRMDKISSRILARRLNALGRQKLS